jgi:hypothetical protein
MEELHAKHCTRHPRCSLSDNPRPKSREILESHLHNGLVESTRFLSVSSSQAHSHMGGGYMRVGSNRDQESIPATESNEAS